MKRELYLVRHGQTLFNQKGIVQGWCDSPLTELGRNQAKLVGSLFSTRRIEFTHAYASPTGRTRETMECITGMPYSVEPGLRELYFGTFEGEHDTVLVKPFTESMFVPFGGETLSGLTDRMNKTLGDIMNRDGHDRVLVVTHGTACEVFLKSWDNYKTCTFEGMPGNCSVMHMEYDAGVFFLKEAIEQKMIKGLLGM